MNLSVWFRKINCVFPLFTRSVENTVFLEVHCPIIQPQLMVLSDFGQTVFNFGDVSIGQRVVKTVTIQNISDRHTCVSLKDATSEHLLNCIKEQ